MRSTTGATFTFSGGGALTGCDGSFSGGGFDAVCTGGAFATFKLSRKPKDSNTADEGAKPEVEKTETGTDTGGR
ncbi:MAG: hypothetical protein NWR76_04135 [Opitutales bacterium]|nr:hypothetical protein [Opitutales bacterium]